MNLPHLPDLIIILTNNYKCKCLSVCLFLQATYKYKANNVRIKVPYNDPSILAGGHDNSEVRTHTDVHDGRGVSSQLSCESELVSSISAPTMQHQHLSGTEPEQQGTAGSEAACGCGCDLGHK